MNTTLSYESLAHSKWDCKYRIVFIPKGIKKALYGKIRKYLGAIVHELTGQKESKIIEGHMVQDHAHMLIKILPKYAVAAQVKAHLKQQEQLDSQEGFEEQGLF